MQLALKQIYMMNNVQNTFSQQFISQLFACSYFIDKFQELQIQTNHDLMHLQSAKQNNDNVKDKAKMIANHNSENNDVMCNLRQLQSQISQILVKSYKEAIFKESNELAQQKLNIMNINQQIQNLKQSINKMGQTSFVNSKTITTLQSLTPDKQEHRQTRKLQCQNEKNEKIHENSMFMNENDQSSIQLGISRKNLAEDRITSFSFMNSFLNQNRISPQDQEIINERINASVSKIQSSIEDRISQLQKEFSRRIQQVMKTIKHLIQMINQNQNLDHQSPQQKSNAKITRNIQEIAGPGKLTKNLQTNKKIFSKSTIVKPQKDTKVLKQDKSHVADAQIINQVNLSHKSSSKIANFFGRLYTSQK